MPIQVKLPEKSEEKVLKERKIIGPVYRALFGSTMKEQIEQAPFMPLVTSGQAYKATEALVGKRTDKLALAKVLRATPKEWLKGVKSIAIALLPESHRIKYFKTKMKPLGSYYPSAEKIEIYKESMEALEIGPVRRIATLPHEFAHHGYKSITTPAKKAIEGVYDILKSSGGLDILEINTNTKMKNSEEFFATAIQEYIKSKAGVKNVFELFDYKEIMNVIKELK